MELLLVIVVTIIVAFFALVIAGHIKGPPQPESLTIEALIRRIQSEEDWIVKYKTLPFKNQQGSGIKRQYEQKKIYVQELQLEFMKKSLLLEEQDLDKTIIPCLRRKIDLMKRGMSEDEAQEQAANEFATKSEEPNKG